MKGCRPDRPLSRSGARTERAPDSAAGRRRLRRSADGERQPPEVASGPYQLVLRDLSAQARSSDGYQPYHAAYEHLFNSYYNGVGASPFLEPGADICPGRRSPKYSNIDSTWTRPCSSCSPVAAASEEVSRRTTLGLHHEQQHQELLLTDLKYNFGHNPLAPVYQPGRPTASLPEPGRRR